MARPRKKVDLEKLAFMAKILCTMKEMSAELGVSVDTLERRYADFIDKQKTIAKVSLRRKCMQIAMDDAHKNQFNALALLFKYCLYTDEQVDKLATGSFKITYERDNSKTPASSG